MIIFGHSMTVRIIILTEYAWMCIVSNPYLISMQLDGQRGLQDGAISPYLGVYL